MSIVILAVFFASTAWIVRREVIAWRNLPNEIASRIANGLQAADERIARLLAVGTVAAMRGVDLQDVPLDRWPQTLDSSGHHDLAERVLEIRRVVPTIETAEPASRAGDR